MNDQMREQTTTDQIKREQAFLKSLQDTLQTARKKGGVISREEITRSFGSFTLDAAQLQQVEAYLKAHRIVVGRKAAGAEKESSGAVAAGSDRSAEAAGSEKKSAGDVLDREEKDFLAAYMEMLEGIPRLSPSVLEAVKISAMAGEPSARRELSEQMLGNVVDIARLYAGQGVSLEDLIAAGNEALASGVTLLGHLESPQEVEGELARRVMDSMEDAVSAMLDEKAMDTELEDLVNLVADKAKELADILGRKVTADELAREGEVTSDQIAEAVRLTGGKIESLAE